MLLVKTCFMGGSVFNVIQLPIKCGNANSYNQTYPCSNRAGLPGPPTIPKGSTFSIQVPTRNSEILHMIEQNPRSRVSNFPVIFRSHKSSINEECDIPLAWTSEICSSQQIPPFWHINNGRTKASTC